MTHAEATVKGERIASELLRDHGYAAAMEIADRHFNETTETTRCMWSVARCKLYKMHTSRENVPRVDKGSEKGGVV